MYYLISPTCTILYLNCDLKSVFELMKQNIYKKNTKANFKHSKVKRIY